MNAPAALATVRQVIVVLTLVLACALGSAAVARAAEPGVNLKGAPTAADVDAAANAGAKWVRSFVHADTLRDEPAFADLHYGQGAARAAARGMGVVLVVVESDNTPTSPATYAAGVERLARAVAGKNPRVAYEIWNEADAGEWWKPAPDPGAYVRLLEAAAAEVRRHHPQATVIVGPTTGNNYGWLEQLYANGLKDSMFDAVAVHTDTACLTAGPDSFYRENGRLGQFTFLGYREVRATLAAHDDADKKIWMTELGWSSTQGPGRAPLCQTGKWANQKPSGVTEDQQADFLQAAYHCLALDPDVVPVALWFRLRDDTEGADDMRRYGLLRANGEAKPAHRAFKAVTDAANADPFPGRPCGDFDAPTIAVAAPTAGQQFVSTLLIRASATDNGGTGLARITFRADGAPAEIRNFTTGLADNKAVALDWQGATKLALGKHTISIEALDANGNTSSKTVEVTKVKTLAATLPTRTTTGKVRCKGRVCVLRGRVSGPKGQSIAGKVQVLWQLRSTVRRKGSRKTRLAYKTIHKGLKNANKPFTFSQRLKRGGRWRVQVLYRGQAPLKRSAARAVTFRVR